jgi:hypothetical protein
MSWHRTTPTDTHITFKTRTCLEEGGAGARDRDAEVGEPEERASGHILFCGVGWFAVDQSINQSIN